MAHPCRTEPAAKPRGRSSGFSTLGAAIAVAASALVVSAAVVVINAGGDRDRSLRVRVDLHLESVRTLHDVTGLLKNASVVNPGAAAEAPGSSPEIVFHPAREGAVTYSLAVVPGAPDSELQLRRLEESGGSNRFMRVIGRHVEGVALESIETEPPGSARRRVTVWLRRVVDRQVYTVRQSGEVRVAVP